MALVKDEVKESLKGAKLDKPNPELVQMTLIKFINWTIEPNSEDFKWMDLAILCWALDAPIPDLKNGTILESEPYFHGFQKLIIRHEKSETITPYLWQGLLNAYFNFEYRKTTQGRLNWESLRRILRGTLGIVLRNASFQPIWLENVAKHNVLFEDDVSQKLAKKSLQDAHTRLIDDIAYDVEIPSTSWFWPDLLLAQVNEITSYSDERFKKAINLVLPNLKKRKECFDAGLALILNRYSICTVNEVHADLKDTSLDSWKSPTLERQREWERVTLEAKKMVQRWLVVEDIRDFFLTLRKSENDDSFDRRRFEFWMQFLDQITFAFLVLGPETRASFDKLLKGKVGRFGGLTGSTRSNNAFVMRVGRVYIVEFSEVGKMFAFEESKIRPHLNSGMVNYRMLRQPANSLFKDATGTPDGIPHMRGWEDRFYQALLAIKIVPDRLNLVDLVERYNLKIESTPSGTEWVRHRHDEGVLADLLRQHKFIYKYRQGFYRNQRTESWN